MLGRLLLSLATISTSVILILAYQYLSISNSDNGFKRHFIIKNLRLNTKLDLNSNNYYFAGSQSGIIYIKDISTGKLYSYCTDNNHLKSINTYDLYNLKQMKQSKINVTVRDSIAYFNNRQGSIVSLSLLPKAEPKLKEVHIGFDQTQPISKNSLAIRQTTQDEGRLGRAITKLNLNTYGIEKSLKLEKQVDGFFSTDGLMEFDKKTSTILYMYFYRGQYLQLDSNLNIIAKIKTIDTVNFAKISISENRNNGLMLTQRTPPKQVNRLIASDGKYVYLVSALRADNEGIKAFNDNQVVDVYGLADQKYLSSFYIPKFRRNKAQSILLEGKNIYILSGQHLLTFTYK